MRNFQEEARQIHEAMKRNLINVLKAARNDVSVLQYQLKELKGKAGYRQKLEEIKTAQKKASALQHTYNETFNAPLPVNENVRAMFKAGRDYVQNPINETKLVRMGLTQIQISMINS